MRNLEPKKLWNRFADICEIPHPSKHEEAICKYIIDFAKKHKLEYSQDEIGNIVIRKAATKGLEKRPIITLQSHLDMVPEKNADKKFDFKTDSIDAYIDGEWVKARGTTLGADNGIGCAAMLAILESDDIKHPPLEALFTVDEETGLTGANALKKDFLKGDILMNLDSEAEGELYVGCAGAVNTTVTLKYKEVSAKSDMAGYALSLRGLKGGHSGMEIILQRANANKLLVRFLREQISANNISISAFDGGGLRNAIPREATAIIALSKENSKKFEKAAKEFEKSLNYEYSAVEENIVFESKSIEVPPKAINSEDQKRIIAALTATPNGVHRMSESMKGLVETSTNMSRVGIKDGKMEVLFMTRCMVNYGKRELSAMIRSVFELAGATVLDEGDYDGWAPNMKSPVLSVMKEVYKKQFGKEPEVRAIHAGLECGILGSKYPKMDMISVGPTICFPHSPDEKVNIKTVKMFYDFLTNSLAQIK